MKKERETKTAVRPKVAVITRTKDRPLLLERAIKSVHAQSMKDFVQVIINDGGERSGVEALVKQYSSLIEGRVKVIHNEVSLGMEAATNKAIKSVDSTYIAIHDDDDSWQHNFLKVTTEHLDESGAMGVVVTTDKITEKIVDNKVEVVGKERWLPGVHEVNLYKQCLDQYACTIAFVYRRAVFKEIGYYDESLPVAADWDFALRFLLQYDIDFVDHEPALANYHHRPDANGNYGNSVFHPSHPHRRYINQLANKWLREDIKAGRLGVGYIVNSLQYDQEQRRLQQQFADARVVRLEGHTNYTAENTRVQIAEAKDTVLQRLESLTVYDKVRKKIRRG